jgi:aminoglycoside phosphotransferase (APT) family kinase protein
VSADVTDGDKVGAVRPGEELDLDKLMPWLRAHVPGLEGGLEGAPDVTQFTGGASNWTYRLKLASHDLILRRAPAGTKAKGAHDMAREFRLQQALKPAYPLVPLMVALCEDEGVLGAPFYVMERIDGVIPRKNMPAAWKLDEPKTRALCERVLDALIALHQVDVDKHGLSSLGKGAGYAERQISGWSERYGKARTWNVPRARDVMAWLEHNVPLQSRICVVHNDFRFDNIVFDRQDPTIVKGVLDWELATLGDPLMDVGNSLAYWIQADDDFFARSIRRQPTHLPGMLTRSEVVARYLEKTGMQVPDFRFYEVYGLFRLAGIAQQIYFRYHHGQTNNPAFKRFWLVVNYLVWRCRRVIARGA